MFNQFFRNEKGQNALETAIILIAFIVVASVFAFAILSAGTSSTEEGEEAIYEGLENVQSSMNIRGAVIAQDTTGTGNVENIVFTVAIVGGNPVDLTDSSGDNVVVIGYRDAAQILNEVDWTTAWVGTNDGDNMLDDGELAEITVDLAGLTTPLSTNTEFTIEVKPPTGAIFRVNRTTPAAIETVMELR
ncbi:MAG: hypothetical protein ACLFTK_02735 [Anaerolineales bacterium]